ncbi:hypothetical protein NBRC116494_21200 [Aurantivibrio plasticivorans]
MRDPVDTDLKFSLAPQTGEQRVKSGVEAPRKNLKEHTLKYVTENPEHATKNRGFSRSSSN